MLSVTAPQAVEAATATARRWAAESAGHPEPPAAKLLARVLAHPGGLAFTLDFVDGVLRPEDPGVAATALRGLTRRPAPFLPLPLRWGLRARCVLPPGPGAGAADAARGDRGADLPRRVRAGAAGARRACRATGGGRRSPAQGAARQGREPRDGAGAGGAAGLGEPGARQQGGDRRQFPEGARLLSHSRAGATAPGRSGQPQRLHPGRSVGTGQGPGRGRGGRRRDALRHGGAAAGGDPARGRAAAALRPRGAARRVRLGHLLPGAPAGGERSTRELHVGGGGPGTRRLLPGPGGSPLPQGRLAGGLPHARAMGDSGTARRGARFRQRPGHEPRAAREPGLGPGHPREASRTGARRGAGRPRHCHLGGGRRSRADAGPAGRRGVVSCPARGARRGAPAARHATRGGPRGPRGGGRRRGGQADRSGGR